MKLGIPVKKVPTEIRTQVAGFKVLRANHYTMGTIW